MMYKNLVCALLLSLCGCSMMEDAKRMLAGDEDNAIPPAELVEFMPSLNVAELWSRRIGKGADKNYLRLSPAYAAQRLYIVDSRGRLQALDATNGREFWARNAIQKQRFWNKGDKAKVTAGPGYGEESLLVGTNDGEVFAYRSQDGKLLWRARVSSEILSAPKRAGGTVIVQYNKMGFNDAQYGPYPAIVGRGRVTDETAPVNVLVPDHPVFHVPNRIDASAWAGWVQERGLYYLDEKKDPRYVDLVSMEDPFKDNPGVKTGALVEARVGRGRWLYVGLGLWRQAPAEVEGAYTLLANLISLGAPPSSANPPAF